MAFFDSLRISGTGMTAQRLRMDIISQNLANVKTTRTKQGGPYQRQNVIFQTIDGRRDFGSIFESYRQNQPAKGVKATRIVKDQAPFPKVYEPNHPDADKDGYVSYPNVNSVEEMTNLISAQRSYEANVTAFNATKSILMKTLEIGK